MQCYLEKKMIKCYLEKKLIKSIIQWACSSNCWPYKLLYLPTSCPLELTERVANSTVIQMYLMFYVFGLHLKYTNFVKY